MVIWVVTYERSTVVRDAEVCWCTGPSGGHTTIYKSFAATRGKSFTPETFDIVITNTRIYNKNTTSTTFFILECYYSLETLMLKSRRWFLWYEAAVKRFWPFWLGTGPVPRSLCIHCSPGAGSFRNLTAAVGKKRMLQNLQQCIFSALWQIFLHHFIVFQSYGQLRVDMKYWNGTIDSCVIFE